jgi:hypothetical protein
MSEEKNTLWRCSAALSKMETETELTRATEEKLAGKIRRAKPRTKISEENRPNRNTAPRSNVNTKGSMSSTNVIKNRFFSLNSKQNSHQTRSSPSSLAHLIENKNEFLVH